MTYLVHSMDGPGAYPNRIASGSALDAILALLERCDVAQVDRLRTAIAARTRPVLLPADSEGGEPD